MQAVVVTFEHLALWSLGCCGNTWVRTPRFDQLASRSVVFDQCYASPGDDAARTELSALAHLLRDRGGAAIVVREGAGDVHAAINEWRQASERHASALLWLQLPGIASPWIASAQHIDAAWPAVCDAETLLESLAATLSEPLDRTSSPGTSLQRALPQLLARGFLARDSIAATPALGRLRRIVYAAAVTALDARVGEILDDLQAAMRQDCLLMATAFGGDLAGTHALLTAGCPPLIEPLVHVPLLVRTGTNADGTRRNALSRLGDIVPTVAELFQVQRDAQQDAHSLWPLLRDQADDVRSSLLLGTPKVGWNLRTREFSCLSPPAVVNSASGGALDANDQVRLFVKPDDPWDTLDVAAQHPDVTARMVDEMRSLVGSPRSGADA